MSIKKAILFLAMTLVTTAAGQEQPQWVPISDSVVAKVAGDNNKAPSFERETAGVAVDPMSGDVYMIVNKHGRVEIDRCRQDVCALRRRQSQRTLRNRLRAQC